MHSLLEKVLEDTQNVSVPWVISDSDLAPKSMLLVAPAPDPASPSSGRSGSQRIGGSSGKISHSGGARSPGPASCSSGGGGGRFSNSTAAAPDLTPPTLKGASGALPSELAKRGRWFARTVGEGAILLTFLPALDVWRKEVSARLERRRALREAAAERKRKMGVRMSASSSLFSQEPPPPPPPPPPPQTATAPGAGWQQPTAGEQSGQQQQQRRQQQPHQHPQKKKKKEQRNARREEDEDDSLGLFLFLVRQGDFGLPIEPQSKRLRDIRNILLAHIPRSHHQAMAFKPARR